MELQFREAVDADLTALVQMLGQDMLGAQREDLSTHTNQAYLAAFAAIKKDPNNELIVVEADKQIVGMLQLTFIPYLTHIGSWRCLVEGVRIHSDFRGQGLGKQFFAWVISRANTRGCKILQLTSDKQRPDALRFYEGLGFKASHEGFKMHLI